MKFLSILLVTLLVIIIFNAGCMTTTPAPVSGPASTVSQVIKVDALLALTGSYSSFGEMTKASLLTAEEDINRYYQSIGSSRRVNVVIHDTGSDPAAALRLVKQVHTDGRKFILGHMSSAEIAAIKQYTDMAGMVVLDAGSTSPALAIPGDSIYRLLSDDSAQGLVMGIWLAKNNIGVIIPIWRGDIWGEGLLNSTRAAFSDRKGVTLAGIRYDPRAMDFAASTTSLDILIGKAIDNYGADQVGVYLIGFNESASILREASVKQNLSLVHWFGCDGNTGIFSLTGSAPEARFSAVVNMTGTVWGIPHIDPSSGPQTRIRERLKYPPASGPISLYDALWVVVDVFSDVPVDAGQAQIEASMIRRMSTYNGESKSLLLNAAGDRSLASYDLMQATVDYGGSTWKKVAHVTFWEDGREEISIEN